MQAQNSGGDTGQQNTPRGDARSTRQQVADLLMEELTGEEPEETPEEEAVGEVEAQEPEVEVEEETTEPSVEEPEGEEVPIETIAQLAEQIEADPEWLHSLKVAMSDGIEPISLGELKDAYQEAKRAEGLRERLKTERETFHRESEQARSRMQQELARAAQLPEEVIAAKAEAQAVISEYNSINWAELEQDDPGAAALRKQKLEARYNDALGKTERAEKSVQERLQSQFKSQLEFHRQKILETMPEWSSAETRKAEYDVMSAMLREYGYSAEEIGAVFDYRALHMARDLAKLKGQIKEAEKTVQRVRKIPKPVRAGGTSPTAGDASRQQRLKKLTETASKAPSMRVKAGAIAELFDMEGIK